MQIGQIIVRDREKVSEVVTIGQEEDSSKSGSWFVLQTNYDPSNEPPFFDDRRHPGLKVCLLTKSVLFLYF
jgi:hypothetical protein